MIDTLLRVADMLLGRSDKLRAADADRRQRVSLYFENVSRCLSEIATALKDGKRPWNECCEMEMYSSNVTRWNPHNPKVKDGIIAKVFGDELAEDVGRQVFQLVNTRNGAVKALIEVQQGNTYHWSENFGDQPPSKELLAESIIKIEQAAGKFKALSVLASTLGL